MAQYDGSIRINTEIDINPADITLERFIESLNTFKQQASAIIAELSESITGGIMTAWTSVLDFFAIFWEELKAFFSGWGASILALLAPFNAIPLVVIQSWNSVKIGLAEIWEAVRSNAIAQWTDIAEFLSGLCADVSAVFITAWGQIRDCVFVLWDEITQKAIAIWEPIKTVWGAVAGWFSDYVITPLKTAFNSFKTELIAIWDGIWIGIKNIINKILGGVESFINGIISGINWLILKLNSVMALSGELASALGFDTGFQLPSLDPVSLPRLAQGAVIAPNREFIAILGDQRSGTNVEAPLSTIEEAVMNAMSKMGGVSTGDVNVSVEFKGTLAKLGQVLQPYVTAESSRKGSSTVRVGA